MTQKSKQEPMRLDRETKGRGKYALVKLREVEKLDGSSAQHDIAIALATLEHHGVLDYGRDPATDFFVVRLRDQFAADALQAYADAAAKTRLEGLAAYADDVATLAAKSAANPTRHLPD